MANPEWLKPGYYIQVGEPLNGYYKVTRREPFDYETGEEDTAVFSAVAGGGESGYKNITLLEPDSKPLHLFQVLMGVKDTLFKYYVKLPTGTNIFGTDEDKDIGFIDGNKSPAYDPNPDFMFWLINDFYPAVNAKNGTPFSITPKVFFTGMKYDIQQITDSTLIRMIQQGKIPCRKIGLGGIKTTSRVD